MTDRIDRREVFTPSAEDLHQRLDVILAKKLSTVSRSQIKKMIDSGLVLVNESPIKPGYLVKSNDTIAVILARSEELGLKAENIPLNIVYQDSDIAVIDKPAGMSVHPAAGIRSGTLVNALLFHLDELSQTDAPERPGIVHRLDKLTSGLLVVAKNKMAHKRLADQFKARQVTKEYLALAYGELAHRTGKIDLAIGRDPFDRKKISPRTRHARTAVTNYIVTEYLTGFTLLRVKLLTGRTHQIRVHFSSIGHPLVGDHVYGGNRYKEIKNPAKKRAVIQLKRHFLHATLLEFVHPTTGGLVTFNSPLPPELVDLLGLLK